MSNEAENPKPAKREIIGFNCSDDGCTAIYAPPKPKPTPKPKGAEK